MTNENSAAQAQRDRYHILKTDPEAFQAVLSGAKTLEIRLNDRGYAVGDVLGLRETKHTGAEMLAGAPLLYTGRECQRFVSHVLTGYGLADGWCCLSFRLPHAAGESAPVPHQDAASLIEKIADSIIDNFRDAGWSMPSIDSARVREAVKTAMLRNDGQASAPVADRQRLRELVDVVWNEATESTAVPDTPWADRLIDKVFPSLAASAPVAGEATKLVVVPDAIRLMAQRIAADDFEHCTADPIFTVQRRDQITGLDLDYDCEVGWFHDGDQITGDKAAALEAAYQESCTVPDDYTRTGIAETWDHFATYVTMEAAQEFVAKKGPKYRVYVDSGCRNHEWKALRALLLQIADASYLLAAPQADKDAVMAALGIPKCGRPLCGPVHHHPLCQSLRTPANQAAPICSCPSGDGSLRPCALHPAKEPQ